MSDETTTETTVETGEETTSATPSVESATQAKPQGKTYSEAEYKGLQAVLAKKDVTIKELTEKLINAEAAKAELESNHGKVSNEKATVDTKLTETKKEASTLKEELAKLQKKLSHQEIIMKDFSDLSPVAHLIPESESEEEFREKAKEFRQTLNGYVNSSVKQVLGGSSPPVQPENDGATLGVDELDKAYRDVVSLAAVPGKEKEYEEAREKWLSLMDDDN